MTVRRAWSDCGAVAARAALLLTIGGLLAACSPAGPQPGARPPDRVPTRPPAQPVPDDLDIDLTPGVLPSAGLDVRIGLGVDQDSVVVGASGQWQLVDVRGTIVHQGAPGERLVMRAQDGRLYARRADGRGIGPLSELTRVRLLPGAAGHVQVDTLSYRGILYFLPTSDGGITTINALDLEEYLLGVVPREIPMTQVEAVKAQAVAARTYAVGHLDRRGELGFDFHPTVEDQVYGGARAEHPVALRAVRETAGEIMTYDGRPIQAYYHSTCGGETAAIDEVWDAAPQPYLRSVSDAKPGGGYYCERSNRFHWTQEWTGLELRGVLSRWLVPGRETEVRRVSDITVEERTPSDRIGLLRMEVDGRTYTVGGDDVRRVLRTPDGRLLNSSRFRVRTDRSDGRVTRLVAEGGGWGHGIGMCQVGAMGRAAEGQDYREILTTYYRGAEITRLD